MNRRGFLRTAGAGLIVASAPAIVQASNIMPVKMLTEDNIFNWSGQNLYILGQCLKEMHTLKFSYRGEILANKPTLELDWSGKEPFSKEALIRDVGHECLRAHGLDDFVSADYSL